jgi:quercetin dioxygenase-like cupin family protein
MSATKAFVYSAEIGWEKAGEGIRRQVLGHGTDLMIVRVEFDGGAAGTMHQHPHRQGTYIVSGRFRATVGGEEAELGAGDCFYAPKDVPHVVTAVEGGVLIDVFTPVREDFLQPVG